MRGPLYFSTAGRWWRVARDYFQPPPLTNAESFAAFLGQRAAFIAQKSAVDYCRGKTGLSSFALFTERRFQDALAICQWESVAAVLADLLIVAEGHLRPYVAEADRARVRDALRALYPSILGSLGQPDHRKDGWSDMVEAFERRFAAAHAREPQPPADVAEYAARRMFETLPIHADQRRLDEPVIHGAVRFRTVAVFQEMSRRLAKEAVLQDLLGRPSPPP